MHHSISLYIKIETIIQDLVSRVTSQLFSSLLYPFHLTQCHPKLLPCPLPSTPTQSLYSFFPSTFLPSYRLTSLLILSCQQHRS